MSDLADVIVEELFKYVATDGRTPREQQLQSIKDAVRSRYKPPSTADGLISAMRQLMDLRDSVKDDDLLAKQVLDQCLSVMGSALSGQTVNSQMANPEPKTE